ncbi:MAG: hypothetical protein Q9163_003320 [Psora crenata]
MVREELVAPAVSCKLGIRNEVPISSTNVIAKVLQNPSVASSALDKRIAFLKSKNLTQEEVDIALARAGNSAYPPVTAASTSASTPYPHLSQQAPSIPSGYGLGYGPYQSGHWAQPPPP